MLPPLVMFLVSWHRLAHATHALDSSIQCKFAHIAAAARSRRPIPYTPALELICSYIIDTLDFFCILYCLHSSYTVVMTHVGWPLYG
ncbi:hypothetical protein BD413DRAFT_588875 [Trametes elegans]|nr:hypothetical protein BD413DRAFT_588875 [Trametes elegans]